MRWAVFFLFIFNALIFVWFVFQDDAARHLQSDGVEVFDFSSVEKILLLDEISEADLEKRDIRSSQVGVIESQDTALDSACILVGPFLEVISAKQARSRLEERGLAAKTVIVPRELPVVNWVYIAPQADRKKALALLRELQEKNIESFLIADGEYENGISLGFFSSPEAAKEIMEERAKEGYPVSMTERRREQKTYWLSFDEEMSTKLVGVSIDGLEEGNFALKKQEKTCAEVALLQIIE